MPHTSSQDASFTEILTFLDAADQHGAKIPTVIAPSVVLDGTAQDHSTHNVAFEARQIKRLYLKLKE
jgi:tetratricopeptide repeat protein 30